MADNNRFVQTSAITANPAGATEATIATLTGVDSLFAQQSIKLHGYAAFQVAASTTSVVLKLRRDSVTGTTVATSPTFNGGDVTTPKLNAWDVFGIDTPTELASGTYVMTVTLAGAGGATTISSVWLEARADGN